MDDAYRIKNITFQGSSRRILLQSENGPCPLLALANVLLLRNQMKISLDTRYATLDDLLHLITNFLLDLNANISVTESSQTTSAAFRGNFDGCLNVLPSLNSGMDVNVQFRSIDAFEFTQELGIFDLLDIRLLHGWVVSAQDRVMYDLLGNESYNTVVERIFRLQDDNASLNDKQEAALMRNWLDETCSQLTFDGLLQLHEGMRDRELAILFRNSHFATIFKHDDKLFLLNTDIGFQRSNLIWEQLDELDGDTNYVGHDFYQPTATTATASVRPVNSDHTEVPQVAHPLSDPTKDSSREFHGSDEEFARRLFHEDQARAHQLPPAPEVPAPPRGQPASSGAAGPHADIGRMEHAAMSTQLKTHLQPSQQQQPSQEHQQRRREQEQERERQTQQIRANRPDATGQQRPAAASRPPKKKNCSIQ
eukprot:GEMP01025099.1.p1 GENE.GEMP01025099.1~~GEMP01025099.1.p1  ORF type:complete len:422 (+),score=97.19 GEMP01025099.1:173-1438(+)